jgi:hypothetical protein
VRRQYDSMLESPWLYLALGLGSLVWWVMLVLGGAIIRRALGT